MKILQINKFYNPEIGGVETVVQQYSETACKSYEVTVLCASKNLKLKTTKESLNNVNIIRCGSLGTFFSMPVSFSFIIYFLRIYKQYDILHFHEPFPLASILSPFISRKKKIVITWHSDIIKQKFLKSAVEFFQRKMCEKADIITTTSPNLLNSSKVISKYKNKSYILPLGLTISNYTQSNLEGEYILYIGRLSYYKGIEVILNAFEKSTSKLPLYIVGDGDDKIISKINLVKANSSKKIVFINRFVSEEEKREFLLNCAFLVFPSIEESEAFGIIQLEAMISGKPVINTSLNTGVPYVSLHDQTGLTVKPKCINELSNAINLLSDDVSKRNSFGENAIKRVNDKFSNVILFDKLRNIYKGLIN